MKILSGVVIRAVEGRSQGGDRRYWDGLGADVALVADPNVGVRDVWALWFRG